MKLIPKIGELYKLEKYCFLVFPTKEIVVRGDEYISLTTDHTLAALAQWVSEKLNCIVTYTKPEEIFLIVDFDKKKNFIKVLGPNQSGWINLGCDNDSSLLKEVKEKIQ